MQLKVHRPTEHRTAGRPGQEPPADPSRVRVLVVSRSLHGGGAERFASTLLCHLNRTEIDPSLCLLRNERLYPVPEDVTVTTLGYRRPWQVARVMHRLHREIERVRPQVVLSNIAATNLMTGLALRRCRHRPRWIARIGNSPMRHDGMIRSLLARRVYPEADQFVANSDGLAREFQQVYGLQQQRITVIGNPTDFDRIDSLASEKPDLIHTRTESLVIAVGRLAAQKRYDVMLKAFAKVVDTVPARLWIVGDGPERTRLQNLCSRLNLNECVTFTGYSENPYALLAQASLFLMSSDHEGLPNSLIEAQGLGIPAIATCCPHGPDEIITDGSTGLLTPVGDPDALATAVVSLLDDRARRRGMSKQAVQTARFRFNVHEIAGRWNELLRTAVSRVHQPCVEDAPCGVQQGLQTAPTSRKPCYG